MDKAAEPNTTILNDVLDYVEAWRDGRPILDIIRAFHGRGRDIYTAIRTLHAVSGTSHRLWRPLNDMIRAMEMNDVTKTTGQMIYTTDGWWNVRELRRMGATFETMPDGREKITLPLHSNSAVDYYLNQTRGKRV